MSWQNLEAWMRGWTQHMRDTSEVNIVAASGQGRQAAAQSSSRRLSGRGIIKALITIIGLAQALSGPAFAQRPADGDVVAQHGDWQVVCKPPPPGSKDKVCALVQSVTAEDRNNVGLTVYFQVFSNGTQVLRVFAPLGILLPPGLGLKIDGKDVGNAPFLRCHSFACYAQVVVKEELTKQLSTGKTAIFVIFQTEEAGIGIPISLSGFAKGLAALK
jgi:invasion protein IalB